MKRDRIPLCGVLSEHHQGVTPKDISEAAFQWLKYWVSGKPILKVLLLPLCLHPFVEHRHLHSEKRKGVGLQPCSTLRETCRQLPSQQNFPWNKSQDRLAVQLSWQRACPACPEPWVQGPPLYKPSIVVHTSDQHKGSGGSGVGSPALPSAAL